MELNRIQRKLVDAKPGTQMLIRGVAGSGKTTVAVHRALYLKNEACLNKNDKVLLVTYNKTLCKYIDTYFDDLDESYISLLKENKDRIDIKTVDAVIHSIYKSYYKKYPELASNSVIEKFIQHAIFTTNKKYDKDVYKGFDLYFLKDEIFYLKANYITKLDEYLELNRVGRNTNKDKKQIRLAKDIKREYIFSVCKTFNKYLKDAKLLTFQDLAIEVIELVESVKCKYTHILVDESQDLTKVQLYILNKILDSNKEHSSITFVADTAQSIYRQGYLSHHSYKSIGFNIVGRSTILSKNYRTTCQIANASYSLVKNDNYIVSDINYVKPTVIEKNGPYPLYRHFDNEEDEYRHVYELIDKKLLDSFNLDDIAICTRRYNELEKIKTKLDEKGLSSEIIRNKDREWKRDKIKLITLHSIKGLEFKVVVLIDINKNIIPNQYVKTQNEMSIEKKLLYVGMTRATNRLYIYSCIEASPFINMIDKKYLRDRESRIFNDFYKLGTEAYRFRNKIARVFSREEIVRQWAIEECIKHLGLKIEQIDIEYNVSVFSKQGYVDMVVYSINEGIKIPYIFFEFKREDEELDGADRQLKSYMAVVKSVQYGVVSNGKKTYILQKYFDRYIKVNALPTAKEMTFMLDNIYSYREIKSGNSYKIYQDKDDVTLLFCKTSKGNCFEDNFSQSKVYGRIACGEMNYVLEEEIMQLPIPNRLVKDNSFILMAKGDSMIDASINDGDLVVIEKRNNPKEGDIVCATFEDEATLKYFYKQGDSVKLVPGNRKYSPIIKKGESIIINGIVTAVIERGQKRNG